MDTPPEIMTWIELSRSAYSNNIHFFKSIIGPNSYVRAVVKANAYGHGLDQIVSLALENGLHDFAVHSYEEAKAVQRLTPQSSILIMGPMLPADIEASIEAGFHFVVFDPSIISYIKDCGILRKKQAHIHLKIETGTNRLGMPADSIPVIISAIQETPQIKIAGMYTHFANIEDSTDHRYAIKQLEKFNQATNILTAAGIKKTEFHTACSAAILLFPETHFNFVRLGLSQYGLWPSRETFVSYQEKEKNARSVLNPVLSFRTRIGQVKTVHEGEYIGYGCTYKTTRKSRIAVLPVGYSDGLDRKLSNNGYVLVKGKRAPIRGRICMNLTMIDVTDIPGVKPYDPVTLIGRDGNEIIRIEDIASLSNTIHYETVSKINPAIPRLIVS